MKLLLLTFLMKPTNKFVVRLVRNSTLDFLCCYSHFDVYSSPGCPQQLTGVFSSLLHTYASYFLESYYAAKILSISHYQAHLIAPFFSEHSQSDSEDEFIYTKPLSFLESSQRIARPLCLCCFHT